MPSVFDDIEYKPTPKKRSVFDEIDADEAPKKRSVFDEIEEESSLKATQPITRPIGLPGYPNLGPLDSLADPLGGFAPVVGRDQNESVGRLSREFGNAVVRDPLVSLAKGVVGVPAAVTGIADIVTGGGVGDALERATGYSPKITGEFLEKLHSDEQQAANKEVSDAKGFLGTAKALASNPTVVAGQIIESLPQMLAGGAVSKGIALFPTLAKAGKLGQIVAGAAGEGVVGAGSTATQAREQSDSGLLTLEQSLLSLASGVATSLLSVIGGKVSQKLGVADIDSAMAGAVTADAKKSTARKIVDGLISEGLIEETSQSTSEKIFDNLINGKPWMDGVAEAAANGLFTGSPMGAVFAAKGGAKSSTEADQNQSTLDAVAAEFNKGREAEAKTAPLETNPYRMSQTEAEESTGSEGIKYIQDKFGVDRDTAVKISGENKEFYGLIKTPKAAESKPQKQAAPEAMDFARSVADMTVEEFREKGQSFNKQNVDLGLNASDEQLAELIQLRDKANARSQASMASNPQTDEEKNVAITESMMPQFYKEAIQIAQTIRDQNMDFDQRVFDPTGKKNLLQFTLKDDQGNRQGTFTISQNEMMDIKALENKAKAVRASFNEDKGADFSFAEASKKPSPETTTRLSSASPSVKNSDGSPKEFFHGSHIAGNIKDAGDFKLDRLNKDSLFGPMIYFTDKWSAAAGQPIRNRIRSLVGLQPQGYATKPTEQRDFFGTPEFTKEQLESPASPGVVSAFLDVKNPLDMERSISQEEMAEALSKLPPEIAATLENRMPPEATGLDLYKNLVGAAEYFYYRYSRSGNENMGSVGPIDFRDGAKPAAGQMVQAMGFDAISYLGGVRRGGVGKHSVIAVFSPSQVLEKSLTPVNKYGGTDPKQKSADFSFAESTNPGGSEQNLSPEQRAISRQNNSVKAFAEANGVTYEPGDTGSTILEKVNAKKNQPIDTKQTSANIPYGQQSTAATTGTANTGAEASFALRTEKPGAKRSRPRTLTGKARKLVPGERGGRVTISHWSNSDLTKKKIDPKYHGKGIQGAERLRKVEYPDDFPARSYYGLSGYSPEHGLGPKRHDVEINADHLYDYKSDPDNIYEKAQDEAEKRFPRHFGERYDQAVNTIYERLISEAGYVGYYNGDFSIAAVFKALPGSGKADFSMAGKTPQRTALDVLSGWPTKGIKPPQRVDFELSSDDKAEGASGYSKVFAVADHLSRRVAEAFGALRELTEENAKKIASAMASEVEYAVGKNSKAVGWYGSQMRSAMRSLIERHPDLDGDKGRQAIIRAMIAITSNGQDVQSNFTRADELYKKWKQSGKIEVDGNWGGVNKNAINDGLKMLDSLINVLGVENLPKFLSGKFTVAELRAAGLNISGEKSSHETFGSLVFGPKIGGGFYQNLSGNFDPVTMDRWFMRTFNRYRGTLTEASIAAIPRQIANLTSVLKNVPGSTQLRADAKRILAAIKGGTFDPYAEADSPGPLLDFAKKKLIEYTANGFRDRSDINRASQRLAEEFFGMNEAPANASERDFIRNSVNKAQQILKGKGINLTNADLQAVLWYLEKEVYGKLGATSKRAEPASYADAAKSIGRKQRDLFEEPERAGSVREEQSTGEKVSRFGEVGKAVSPKKTLEAIRRRLLNRALRLSQEQSTEESWAEKEPVTRESVQRELMDLQADFPSAAPTVVVNTYNDLPNELHQLAYAQGGNPALIGGVLYDGKVYIVASMMSSLAEARATWLHEQAGHFATDAILGEKLDGFMQQVYDSFKDHPLMEKMRKSYKRGTEIRWGREFIANLAENPTNDPNLWNKIVAMFRQFLRDAGLVKKVSENDIRVLLDSAMNKLMSQDTIVAGNATIFAPSLKMTGYHGTPHKIKDRFRTDRIGSGEGAQVYGWGLYFAQQQETAKHYRDVLSDPEYYVDGEKIETDAPIDPINIAIEKILLLGQDRAEAYAAQIAGIEGQSSEFWMNVLNQMVSLRGKKIEQKAGNLYTVEINFDPEDTIDYEGSAADLPRNIYNKLHNYVEKHGVLFADPDEKSSSEYFIAVTIRDFLSSGNLPAGYRQTAGDFYDKLGYQIDGAKAVSEFLLSLGIKGIRFADQGTRDKEQKTYNYVVFDDGDITITHENGEVFKPEELIENPKRKDASFSFADQPELPGMTEEQKAQERKATQGRFFTGDYTATDRQQQMSDAKKFIEHTPNSEVIDSIAQFASGKSVPGLSQQNVSATIAAVMKRMFAKIGTSKNPAEVAELWRLMDRAKSLAQQEGSVVAQTLEARKVFGEELGFMSPVLAFRGLAQKAWAAAFGLPEGQSAEEVVSGTTRTATQEAGEEVQDEIEESEAEGLAQRIINEFAKSQSDTLSWPKKADASVKEVVKWYILGDITDAEFSSTMDMLGIAKGTTDILLSVSQRERAIRKQWDDAKPKEAQDRKKNQAEMRKLRAQAMIALRLGATAENQVDAVINEFAKSQSDTPPAERAKQANGVKEAVKGMLNGDIKDSEFDATLENIGIAATKRRILTSIVKREIEIRKQWKLQKEKEKQSALTAALLNSDSKIAAILNKAASEGGINWSELFLDESRATQKERREHLLAEIRKHPKLQGLTPEQSVMLENALSKAWESARMQVFKREFAKRIKLPTVEAGEKLFKKVLPELIRQANLGTLDDSAFLNAFAKELGLPSLTGEAATKLTKLAQEAQTKPEGVLQNKILQQMIDVIQQTTPAHPLDIVRDYWYNNALSGTRTLTAILTGSWIHGAIMAAQQAMDAAILKRRPGTAGRILQAFLSDSLEGVANGWDVFWTGDYTRRAEFSGNINRLLSGQGKLDSLEGWLKHGNMWQKALGLTSYVRRAVVGLDYVGAIGTRGSSVIYNALLDSPEELQGAMTRFDKEKSAQAKKQAQAELGPDAKWVDVRARQLEILEAGISQQTKDNATVLGEIAALNAQPVGWGGVVYRLLEAMPRAIQSGTGSSKPAAAFAAFAAKTAAGLAFARAAINMTQSASNWMPIVGGVNYARAILGKKAPHMHWSRVFGILDNEGNPIPEDRRRLIAAAQLSGLALAAIAYAMTRGGDDEEDKFDMSGSWYGLTPQQRKDKMASGERPLSIRVGGRWINYGNLPFGGALAMIGNMRDKERKDGKRMSPDESITRMVDAWASGLFYIKDLSVISGLSRTLGISAMNTDESASALNRLVAQQAGNAAGLIPFNSAVREIDTFFDPNVYKPTKGLDYWVRGIPFVRRTVGEGPEYNMAGLPVENMLTPQSRLVAADAKRDPVVAALSSLIAKGAFPHHPDISPTWVKNGQQLSAKDLPKESYGYQIQVLKRWREVMLVDAEYLKTVTPEEYESYFKETLAPIRDEVKMETQEKIDPEALDSKGKVKKEYRK